MTTQVVAVKKHNRIKTASGSYWNWVTLIIKRLDGSTWNISLSGVRVSDFRSRLEKCVHKE